MVWCCEWGRYLIYRHLEISRMIGKPLGAQKVSKSDILWCILIRFRFLRSTLDTSTFSWELQSFWSGGMMMSNDAPPPLWSFLWPVSVLYCPLDQCIRASASISVEKRACLGISDPCSIIFPKGFLASRESNSLVTWFFKLVAFLTSCRLWLRSGLVATVADFPADVGCLTRPRCNAFNAFSRAARCSGAFLDVWCFLFSDGNGQPLQCQTQPMSNYCLGKDALFGQG